MTYFTDRSRKIQWSSEETQKLSHTHAAHMNTLIHIHDNGDIKIFTIDHKFPRSMSSHSLKYLGNRFAICISAKLLIKYGEAT